jgi:hypothetical protein
VRHRTKSDKTKTRVQDGEDLAKQEDVLLDVCVDVKDMACHDASIIRIHDWFLGEDWVE